MWPGYGPSRLLTAVQTLCLIAGEPGLIAPWITGRYTLEILTRRVFVPLLDLQESGFVEGRRRRPRVWIQFHYAVVLSYGPRRIAFFPVGLRQVILCIRS